jgi:hypothetical protein
MVVESLELGWSLNSISLGSVRLFDLEGRQVSLKQVASGPSLIIFLRHLA